MNGGFSFIADLGQMYYDTLASGAEELALLERTIARASKFEGREEGEFFFEQCQPTTFTISLTLPLCFAWTHRAGVP